MSKSSASQTAVAAIGRSTANWSKWVMSVVPWLIIGGLLWAGLFIKPAPVGSTVQPPVLERRDYFYGVARPADDRIWFAGSNGKIVSIAKDGRTERLATGTDSTLQDLATWDDQHSVAVGNDGSPTAAPAASRLPWARWARCCKPRMPARLGIVCVPRKMLRGTMWPSCPMIACWLSASLAGYRSATTEAVHGPIFPRRYRRH